MAAFILPCASAFPDFTFQCELDGVTYQFHFRWNERVEAWFMDMLDVSGNPLVNGLRVTVGFPLAARTRYNVSMPPGSLIAWDTSGEDEDPRFEDLGSRVQLLYYSTAADDE